MNNPNMVADTSLVFYLNSKDVRSFQSGTSGWVDLRIKNRYTGQLNNMSLITSGGYLFFNGLTITGTGSGAASSGSGSFSFIVDNSGNFLINNSGDFIVSGSGSGGGGGGGGAVSSGAASYVDVSSVSVGPNCSLMFWTSSSNYRNVSGASPISWGSNQSNYSLLFTTGIYLTGNQIIDFYTAPPNDTGWHNFIITFNSQQNSSKLYIDGILAGGSSMIDTTITNGTIRIGEKLDPAFPFSGYINGVAIYRKTLTSGEVRRNFRATRQT